MVPHDGGAPCWAGDGAPPEAARTAQRISIVKMKCDRHALAFKQLPQLPGGPWRGAHAGRGHWAAVAPPAGDFAAFAAFARSFFDGIPRSPRRSWCSHLASSVTGTPVHRGPTACPPACHAVLQAGGDAIEGT